MAEESKRIGSKSDRLAFYGEPWQVKEGKGKRLYERESERERESEE